MLNGNSYKPIEKFLLLPRYTVVFLLRAYQKTLSPDHGLFRHKHPFGYCRFHPTCSQYAVEAISRYGLLRGGAKSLWRLLRCNPFSRGGVDPVK